MLSNSFVIEVRAVADLKPYSASARIHSKAKKKKLQALLARFGLVRPILVDHENVVVDGHAVLEAWSALGNSQIEVVVAATRDPAEIKALRLALNRVADEAGWDKTALKAEFDTLIELGFDMTFTAFDAVEIDMALAIDEPSSGEVEDPPPAPSEGPPVTQPGDIWRLGEHKVACGDARDAGLTQRLLGGATIDLVFSDPPYNVPIAGFVVGAGRHREFGFASGEMSEAQFAAFLTDSFAPAVGAMRDGAVAFWCMDWRHIGELLVAARQLDLALLNLCVWAKTNAGMGSLYRSQHELVFVLKKGEAAHANNVELGKHGRARSNLWTYRGMSSFGADRELLGAHPTVKPVLLVADAVKDVSRRGELVFDPFLGSGTTLIAAHRTGRRCCGIELDPAYVDVIVRRWEAETGREAVLEGAGVTFTAAAETRQAMAGPAPLMLAGPTTVEG